MEAPGKHEQLHCLIKACNNWLRCFAMQVLDHFFASFKAYNAAIANGTSNPETGDVLAHAMKFIIIPLITWSFELQQHELVDEAAVSTMVKDMFDPVEEVQGTPKFW